MIQPTPSRSDTRWTACLSHPSLIEIQLHRYGKWFGCRECPYVSPMNRLSHAKNHYYRIHKLKGNPMPRKWTCNPYLDASAPFNPNKWYPPPSDYRQHTPSPSKALTSLSTPPHSPSPVKPKKEPLHASQDSPPPHPAKKQCKSPQDHTLAAHFVFLGVFGDPSGISFNSNTPRPQTEYPQSPEAARAAFFTKELQITPIQIAAPAKHMPDMLTDTTECGCIMPLSTLKTEYCIC